MSLYGLFLGISTIIGINYFEKNAPKNLRRDINYLIIGVLLSALAGARAYHVIDYWDYYSQNLLEIYKTWHGGLGIFGALIGALMFLFLYSQIKKISLIKILDSITPVLPLCQAVGRVGNFINHENPYWWLEAIADFILYLFIKQKKVSPTAAYSIGYGLIRFITEIPRQDTWVINSFKIGQFLSILLILFGLIIYHHEKREVSRRHSKKRDLDTPDHRQI